jgi:hypothetical protein
MKIVLEDYAYGKGIFMRRILAHVRRAAMERHSGIPRCESGWPLANPPPFPFRTSVHACINQLRC